MNSQLQIAVEAAVQAGEAILKIYDQEFSVELKEDNSPLTEADKASNEVIMQFLETTSIPVISEENRQLDFATRSQWTQCWIVDPLDGTKEFVKRNGEFTVNIALVDNGKPILGVIFVPVTKELYFADVPKGIARKMILQDGQELTHVWQDAHAMHPKSAEGNPIQVVGSRSHMNEETKAFIQELEARGKTIEVVSKGSSLKFCLVAEGKSDVYPRYAPTMEWDTAAGQAICEAVGVKVISLETNQPLTYNKENLRNPWFLCQ